MNLRQVAVLLGIFISASSQQLYGQITNPGRVLYQKMSDSNLDHFTESPSSPVQQWLQTHFYRMGVYSPYFDSRTSWFPNSLLYKDLYALLPTSDVAVSHPEWILKDSVGNPMYIPWGCTQTNCPQYAGDITNPDFRNWWVSQARLNLSKGYLGLWIDDVNMEFRVCDRFGNQAPPVDPATGQLMTWSAWADYVANFVEQIKQSFPNVEIVHNNIWFGGPNGMRDASPAVQREILASTSLNKEQGIGSDTGLTGGTDIWSLYALFAYFDRVHALGRPIAMQEYLIDQPTQEYALAGYYLISTGNDRIGDYATTPDNWWKGWDTDLGEPLGPRTYSGGVFQRTFSKGMVLLGEPNLPTQIVQLPAIYTTLAGEAVHQVTLTSRRGIVLLGTGAGPIGTSKYVSDLVATYSVNGYGPVEKDMSNGSYNAGDGNTLQLNGQRFAKGLGVQAYSEVHYQLSGSCKSFTATVGVDDEVPSGLGLVIFQVWGDSDKLYDSAAMHNGSPTGSVSVDLTNKRVLSLVVTSGANSFDWDHADWANAILTCTQ